MLGTLPAQVAVSPRHILGFPSGSCQGLGRPRDPYGDRRRRQVRVLFTGQARNSRRGRRGWADGAEAGRGPSGGPSGRRRADPTVRRHRGAGVAAAPRQERERGPGPGGGSGRPEGGAWPGAEPGAIPAQQALGAGGRGSRAVPKGHRVLPGPTCPLNRGGTLSPFPEPQSGPQPLHLSPSGDPRSPS